MHVYFQIKKEKIKLNIYYAYNTCTHVHYSSLYNQYYVHVCIFVGVHTFVNWSISFKEVWLEEHIKNVTTRGKGEREGGYTSVHAIA